MIEQHRRSKGITVVELFVVMAILAIALVLTSKGVRLINGLYEMNSRLQQLRQSQELLFQITSDTRAAHKIIDLTDTSLKLMVYNPRLGYDVEVSRAIFDPVNMGTVTYQLTGTTETILRWSVDYPGGPKFSKDLMVNILEPDDPATPDHEFLFAPSPFGAVGPDYPGVQIVFRLAKGRFEHQVKIYRSTAQLRRLQGEQPGS